MSATPEERVWICETEDCPSQRQWGSDGLCPVCQNPLHPREERVELTGKTALTVEEARALATTHGDVPPAHYFALLDAARSKLRTALQEGKD